MATDSLSVAQFGEVVAPLIGLEVSLAWKGWGSAVFLELGRLTPAEPWPSSRPRPDYGEARLHLGWEWRLEAETTILLGSSNSSPKIERIFPRLKGDKIVSIALASGVPELTIHLSSEARLRTMTMWQGDPGWSIRLLDSRLIYPRQGAVVFAGDDQTPDLSEEEAAAFDRAGEAAKRWGTPVAEPKGGDCRDCRSFVRLDGNGHLLEYGACTESTSPFDGRVVRCRSGCPAFSAA